MKFHTASAAGALAALTATAGAARAVDSPPVPAADTTTEAPPERKTPGPRDTWFQVKAGIGVQHVDLTTFRAERSNSGDSLTADLIPSAATGPQASLGGGFRLLFMTFGVRGSVTHFQDSSMNRTVGGMQLYSAEGEVGFEFLQIGRVVPSLFLGGGYSTFGGLDDAVQGVQQGLDVDGANLKIGAGVDYYFSPTFSLGVRGGWGVLFLARRGVPLRDLASAEQVGTIGEARARLLEGAGSSIGTAVFVGLEPALHF